EERMLGKDEKQTFVSIDFMTQKSSKHPSTSLDQNEHAFNFVGDVCFGFVFDPQARARTIQPQAAKSFALIPDWLRFAHFAAPDTPLASACHSLRIHWPLTTGH